MAFDITPYIHQTPAQVRAAIRRGEIDFPTAGMCAGYAQANLVILPPEYAADFEEYTRLNPFPCPVLEIVKGSPITHAMGEGASLVTDIPRNTAAVPPNACTRSTSPSRRATKLHGIFRSSGFGAVRRSRTSTLARQPDTFTATQLSSGISSSTWLRMSSPFRAKPKHPR